MAEAQGQVDQRVPPPPLGPLWGPRHSPTVGCQEEAVSYERGAPVCVLPSLDSGADLEHGLMAEAHGQAIWP